MEPWHYESADDLDQSLIARLRRFPREPDMLVFGLRSLSAMVLRGWLRLYHRLSVVGQDNLPADGSFVMIANHCSHLDTLCLTAALPMAKLHRAFPAAAKDYFFVSAHRVLMAAIIANALPFDRRLGPRGSLEICSHLLANPGNILIIFPEGTRSATGELHDFKPGVGLLLAESAVPVVPCYLDGTYAAWPKGVFWPRPRSIRLIIGKPRCYQHLPRNKQSAVQISAELHAAVGALAPAQAPAALLAAKA
jgi:1-acyl-sn-glycerol-3-phosphate acyltransferase